MTSNLLRAVRTDADGGAVLVHVTASPKDSAEPLKLTLEATEGERGFKTKLRPSKLSSYRHEQFSGDNPELEVVLLYVLRRQIPEDRSLIAGIKCSAAVGDEGVTLGIHKELDGISQEVAHLKLSETEDEINAIEWALESCATLDTASNEIQACKTKLEARDVVITDLNRRLDSFVTLKREHEEALLVKFQELLNSKKAKIREMAEELESARKNNKVSEAPSVESGSEDQEDESKAKGKARTAKGKNKASASSAKQAATRDRRGTASTRAPARNTRKRKLATPESDDESDEFAAPDSSRSRRTSTRVQKVESQPPPDETPTASEDEAQLSDSRSTEDEDELPPVRRPIGYQSQATKLPELEASAASKETEAGGDETEDDEL